MEWRREAIKFVYATDETKTSVMVFEEESLQHRLTPRFTKEPSMQQIDNEAVRLGTFLQRSSTKLHHDFPH